MLSHRFYNLKQGCETRFHQGPDLKCSFRLQELVNAKYYAIEIEEKTTAAL